MSEIADVFDVINIKSKQKRTSNRLHSAKMLQNAGVVFEVRNDGAHLIVECTEGLIDFWPGTGRWIVRKNGFKEYGVSKLILYVTENVKN